MLRRTLAAVFVDAWWNSPCCRPASPQVGEPKKRQCMRENHQGRRQRRVFRVRFPAALPSSSVRRPVSGLASLDLSPSQAFAQWPIDTPTLAYRCGDSTGMVLFEHAPVSRLTAAAKLRSGTLHDLPQSEDCGRTHYSSPTPCRLKFATKCAVHATNLIPVRRLHLDRTAMLNL